MEYDAETFSRQFYFFFRFFLLLHFYHFSRPVLFLVSSHFCVIHKFASRHLSSKMQTASLVKYNTPTLISGPGKGKKGEKKAEKPATTQTEDILNSILPPRSIMNTICAALEYILF